MTTDEFGFVLFVAGGVLLFTGGVWCVLRIATVRRREPGNGRHNPRSTDDGC